MIAQTTSAQILRFPPARRRDVDRDRARRRQPLNPLRAACTCHVTGVCRTCRAWDLRVRLAELIAGVA
ncbi:hypothetical protein GALL_372530 [mine drainage metagenome]|uniref:Uncharacterized protein n=1 Tax=mine drainage metagenome TaxID=410659 RepID=A0A1J5QC52_9ZZZZ